MNYSTNLFSSPPPDSTTARMHSARGAAETVRHRAALLNGPQKTFLEMILENGSTADQIARLTGLHPSTVSRRFNRLVRKLHTGQWDSATAGKRWTPQETAILRDYYVHGMCQLEIVQKRGVSRYSIRRILTRFRQFGNAAGSRPHRQGGTPCTR